MVKMASLPKKITPMRRWLEELRRKASADLERTANKPLSEKTLQDLALLDSARTTKH
jgi:hypothetical protein